MAASGAADTFGGTRQDFDDCDFGVGVLWEVLCGDVGQILHRGTPGEIDVQAYLRVWLADFPPLKGDVRLTVDIDPYGFLWE